jgi:hypothetical protein
MQISNLGDGAFARIRTNRSVEGFDNPLEEIDNILQKKISKRARSGDAFDRVRDAQSSFEYIVLTAFAKFTEV